MASNPRTEVYSDPKRIFKTAEIFYKSSLVLNDNATNKIENEPILVDLLAAVIVNHALSLELMFKCLYCISNNKIIHIHVLIDLFDALDADFQDKITEYYTKSFDKNPISQAIKNELPGHDYSLRNVLQQASHAFVNYRYLHTIDSAEKFSYMLEDVHTATRRLIHELNPDWPLYAPLWID